MTNPQTDRVIRAPWTAEQVTALNAFQHRGTMHPFTCGGEHAGSAPSLVAREDGWHCPGTYRETCDYRQDWAHAFMTEPAAPAAVSPATRADDERRDRYATAIRAAGDTAYGNRPFIEAITDAAMAVADTELAARRAADLRDAEEICDEAGASYTGRALNEQAAGAYELMERFRRKAEEAEQTPAALPLAPVPPTTHATGDGSTRRETVEFFVQAQQPDGTWEQCSSTNTDLKFAEERRAARRRMQPDFTYRLVQRNTIVVVQPLADCPWCESDTEHDVHCPTPETHNWGCGCPSDVAAAIASCPGYEMAPSPCRCPCYGCKHHCSAHNPDDVPAVGPSRVADEEQPAPQRAELKPWQLLGDQPDEPLPQTERLTGGRRLKRDEEQPATEAHPPHDSWLVEWRAEGGDWAVAYPTHDRSKALDRLTRSRQDAPDWQWRLVRETTTYTAEAPR